MKIVNLVVVAGPAKAAECCDWPQPGSNCIGPCVDGPKKCDDRCREKYKSKTQGGVCENIGVGYTVCCCI